MGNRTQIAKKLSEALAKNKTSTVPDSESETPEAAASTSATEAETPEGTTTTETTTTTSATEAETPEGVSAAESASSDDDAMMAQAFDRIESLSSALSTANSKLLSTRSELSNANAELSTAKVSLDEAKSEVSGIQSMAAELLDVFDIRLGNNNTDRTKMSTAELLTEYTTVSTQFATTFPDTQASDTSEENNSTDADAGHSQASGFPISRKKSSRRT